MFPGSPGSCRTSLICTQSSGANYDPVNVQGLSLSRKGRLAMDGFEQNNQAAAVLDALTASICVLDLEGNIVSVNEAWRRFSATNNGSGDYVGESYMRVCDQVEGDDRAVAQEIEKAVSDVLAGRRSRRSHAADRGLGTGPCRRPALSPRLHRPGALQDRARRHRSEDHPHGIRRRPPRRDRTTRCSEPVFEHASHLPNAEAP